MKQTFQILLAVSVLSFASVANATAENLWVEVEGGSWVPNTEVISRLKEHIEPFVSNKAKTEGRKLREWKTYNFQYQGREENGKKFVYVNAFCINDKRWQLKKQVVFVFDGGTCFFNLKYDPKTNQFFSLQINGEA